LARTQHLQSLSLIGGKANLVTGGSRVLVTSVLTVDTTDALIDVWEHAILVDYTGASPLASLRSAIVSARNGGAWNGFGITSSAAASHAGHSTTLGVMEGSDYRSIYGPSAMFKGEPLMTPACWFDTRYYGDSDFNGRVNFDDYVRADNGFNNHLSGWTNGDFDLNGAVNFDDYVLIDLAFNTQNGTLGRALTFLDGSDPGSGGMSARPPSIGATTLQPVWRRLRPAFPRCRPRARRVDRGGVAASVATTARRRHRRHF
jgi:hypothetical protein